MPRGGKRPGAGRPRQRPARPLVPPPSVDALGRLRPKQARFVQEYLIDLNGTHAAIRAGYAAPSAEVTASQLLRFPKVAAAVDKALAARARRCDAHRRPLSL